MNTCGPTASSHLYSDDYHYLSRVVHSQHPGSLSVLNPGISVPRCYEDAGDMLLTFEGSAADYLNMPADLAPQPWQAKADPDKFWNIVYDTDASQLSDVMAASKSANAGYMYVTDDTLPNPYDTVPDQDYWNSEIAAAASTGAPAPAPTRRVSASSASPTSATLSWSASYSKGVAGYDVYSDGRLAASVGRDEGHGRSFHTTVAGLSSASTYSFQVRVRSLTGAVSAPSRLVRVRTAAARGPVPAAPGSVSVSQVAAGSMRLNWSAARASDRVTDYDVYQDGMRLLTLPASVSSVRVSGLALGSTVTFTVQAVGADGVTSPMSQSVSADIPDPDPITAPSVTYNASSATFQAQFNVGFSFDHVFIDTDGSAATGYSFGGIGAEFMIENSVLYKDVDDSNSWNWQPVALSTGPLVSTAGGLHVWSVPSSIFDPSASLQVVFSGTGTYPDYTLTPVTATQSR